MYKIYWGNNGKIVAINRESDGTTIPRADWISLGLDLSDRPPTPEIPQPDWKKFRRGMWPDAGFRRMVKDTADQESKLDLKIAAGVGTDDYTWLKVLWDSCVTGLLVKPTVAEIANWNTIATNSAMPLSFSADGKMVLK